MAALKRKKKCIQSKPIPSKKHLSNENPDKFMDRNPSWSFINCDKEQWPLSGISVREYFWSELLPRFKYLESMTWNEIFVKDKKNNHSIEIADLNKVAQDRLLELHLPTDYIRVIHITGKHCLYGFLSEGIFHILWFDINHGDNSNCVCRSFLKHT